MTTRLQGDLPGGLPTPQGVRRDYRFRPPDGRLQLRLAEIAEGADTMPRAVSQALEEGLAQLAGAAPTEALVDALCVADRQYLMRELWRLLGREAGWYDAACPQCSAPFDFYLDFADLPVKPAAEAYPHTRLEVGDQTLILRLPTGADQIRLLGLPPERRHGELLRSLVVTPALGPSWPETLPAEALAQIEAALEALSPALVLEVAAPCPECGKVSAVGLNPYGALFEGVGDLLGEVHRIASHYHWGEAEILALPQERRGQYLRLIDAARGMAQ